MPATLTRTKLGLLAKHNSDFDTADWTAHADLTLSLSVGMLRIESTSFGPPYWHSVLYDTATVAPRSKSLVQAKFKVYQVSTGAFNACGPAVHCNGGSASADQDCVHTHMSMDRVIGIGEQCNLGEVVDANRSNLDTAQATSDQPRSKSTYYRQAVFADGTDAAGYDFTDDLEFSGTATTLSSGGVGICHQADQQRAEYSDWWACADRYLYVTNLPSGYKAKVRSSGGSVLAEATEVSGVASVDMLKVSFDEAYDLIVTDGSDVVQVTTTPGDGLWGGDEYAWPDGAGNVYWAELSVPHQPPRQGRVYWAELDVPSVESFGPPILALYDGLPCASGSLLGRIPEFVVATVTRDREGRHELRLTAPRSASWVSSLVRGSVLHTRLHNGLVFDWRVVDVTDGMGAGRAPFVEIIGDPVEVDLMDCGPVRTVTSGGLTSYAVAWTNQTPTQIITDIVIPALEDYGITWVEIGDVDPSEELTGSADMVTPAEVMATLEKETGAHFRLRAKGLDGYYLDLVDSLTPNDDVARVRVGVNLVDLARLRSGEDVATVIVVRGSEVGGVRAAIGLAAWRVASITANASLWDVVLEDPDGGDGPVIINDQFVGNGVTGPGSIPDHYLLLPDGSLEEILDSSSPGTFTIGDTHTLAVGDYVYICPDSAGTVLTEVSSPTGLALYGRVCRYYDLDVTGRANLSPNPLANTWTTRPSSMGCQIDGGVSGSTTVDIDFGVPGFVIKAGAIFAYRAAAFGTELHATVASQVTVDDYGEATVTLVQSVTIPDNSCAVIYNIASLPDDWTDRAPGAPHATIFTRRPSTATGSLSATIVSVETDGVLLGGLTPGDAVYAGDKLTFASGEYRHASHDAEADDDGECFVVYSTDLVSTPSVAEAVTIARPSVPFGDNQDAVVQLLSLSTQTQSYAPSVEGPSVRVRAISGLDTLWARAAFRFANHNSGQTLNILEEGDSGELYVPEVAIWNGSSEVAEGAASAFDLDPGEESTVIVSTSYTVAADGNFSVRARGVLADEPDGFSTQDLRADPVTSLLWIELSLSEEEPTETEVASGAAARVLHQAANRTLSARHLWPSIIEITAREMVEFWDLTPAEAKLDLGQSVRLTEPTLGIDEELTVRRITWNLEDPENPRYVLGTAAQDYTERIVRALEELS